MTLSARNPGFKVTVYLQVEYLKTVHLIDKVHYGTVIGNHTQSIEWYQFQ